jgi:PTS system mannose-specific IIA component
MDTMVGLLIVSHGKIAESFLEVASEILGRQEAVRAICLPMPLDEGKVLDAIQKARREVDRGEGILILTDMFGGTPANLCFSLLEDRGIEVLTGMNLPMLLKILASRGETSLGDLARIAMDCGRENIYLAREILEKRTRVPDANEMK